MKSLLFDNVVQERDALLAACKEALPLLSQLREHSDGHNGPALEIVNAQATLTAAIALAED